MGRKPGTPQKEDGTRTDPAVSLPSAKATSSAPTRACDGIRRQQVSSVGLVALSARSTGAGTQRRRGSYRRAHTLPIPPLSPLDLRFMKDGSLCCPGAAQHSPHIRCCCHLATVPGQLDSQDSRRSNFAQKSRGPALSLPPCPPGWHPLPAGPAARMHTPASAGQVASRWAATAHLRRFHTFVADDVGQQPMG